MDLVDDVYLVLPDLWGDPNLIDQAADIVHRVVGCRIEFKNVEGIILVFPLLAVLVYPLGQNPGTGGLADSPGATEQQGLCQMIVFNGTEQGVGYGLLSHHILKGLWAVFPGGYYEWFQYGKIDFIQLQI